MIDTLVTHLRTLGLSSYEARLYLGLLQNGPQNGNELSRTSGVPSSKVYSALEKLSAEGIVHSVQLDGSTEYVCVTPRELIHRLRDKYTGPLDYLEDALPKLGQVEPAPQVLSVSSLDAILQHSRYIIDASKRQINISIWDSDLEQLRDSLAAADARGVRIFAMLYGPDASLDVGSWLQHSYLEIVSDRIGGRMLTLVADHAETLIAHIPRMGQPAGIRTRNQVLCLIAVEYLHHDYVLQRAQIKVGFDQWDRWWLADPDLRFHILGETFGSPG